MTDKSKAEPKITTTFTIAGCPTEVFERFLKFCEGNSRITKRFKREDGSDPEFKHELWYAGGLKMLLDIADADGKNQMLFKKIENVEMRLKSLEDGNTKK